MRLAVDPPGMRSSSISNCKFSRGSWPVSLFGFWKDVVAAKKKPAPPPAVPEPAVPTFRIATRASQLALWQANHVADLVRAVSDHVVEIVHVSTVGDRDQSESLQVMGGVGSGIFTREVQRAVLDGRADIAVHSLKDLPTEIVPGLKLGAVPPRGEMFDALIFPASNKEATDYTSLPQGARVGTGSLRRRAQLLHVRPDLQFLDVRGNVETRLRKLDEGEYDALVLAIAGLRRLGFANRIRSVLSPPVMFAAVGQGALGIEYRAGDEATRALLLKIDDAETRCAVTAEREMLSRLQAGCLAPIGVATNPEKSGLMLQGVVLSPDGKTRLFATSKSASGDPIALGHRVADDLRRQGAEKLIQQSRAAQ